MMMTEAQSEHLASIDWQRGKWADAKGKYSREHIWHGVGGNGVQRRGSWGHDRAQRRGVLVERDYFASEDYVQPTLSRGVVGGSSAARTGA